MLPQDRTISGLYKGSDAPLPVVEVQKSTTTSSTSETVSVSLGTGTFYLSYAPIYSSNGERVGSYNDSSLSFSANLTSEVPWHETLRDNNTLTSGQFAVQYETGTVIYNSAALATPTASYKIRTDAGTITIGAVTVNNGAGASAVNIQDGGNTITVDGTVTANAGTNLNTSLLALEAGGNLATIAGKDFATQTTLAALNAKLVTGSDIGDVTINNGAGAAAVNIQDGGNTITVDGTVTANAGTNLNTSLLALEAGGNLATIAGKDFSTETTLAAINAKLVTGTDIGDVTINNGSGAAAVNIQDGGNTITVDGTVTANAGTNLNTSALALEAGGNLEAAASDLASILGDTSEIVVQTTAIAADVKPLSGAGTAGTLALAIADTWYQCPPAGSVPSSDYVLVITRENSAGTTRWSFGNAAVPSVTYGNKFVSQDVVIELAASAAVFVGSSTAGDDVNWTTKII